MSNIIEIGSAKAMPGEIVEGNMFKEKLTIELFFDPYQSIDKGVTLYD